MENAEISHKEIYDRLLLVEQKVDKVEKNTEDVVAAFTAAAGAFKVLEWIAKAAKPILWIGATFAAISALFSNWRGH